MSVSVRTVKVLLVNNHATLVGGVERYVQVLLEALPRGGVEVTMLAASGGGATPTARGEYRVSAFDTGGGATPDSLRALYRWDLPSVLDRIVERERPDVVHLHLFDVHMTAALLHYFGRRGVPIVHTVHDYRAVCPVGTLHDGREVCMACVGHAPTPVLSRRCNRGSLARSVFSFLDSSIMRASSAYAAISRFLPPSEFVAEMLRRGGIPASKITVLPYAYPAEEDARDLDADPYVLFSGRLHPTKGISVLLDAARILPDVAFRIAGGGSELARVRDAIDGGAANVSYVGFLSREALMRQLKGAACLVLPSVWHDNQPLSIIEAQANGVPVVATSMGGIPEMIIDGSSGVLVPPGDAIALANGVERVTGDSQLARRLGDGGRAVVRQRYDVLRHVDRLKDIYREVVQ
jgi:glycosyltransferase involved in cell wall biosynthesis